MSPRLHYAALHHGQNKFRQLLQIGTAGKAVLCGSQTRLHSRRPAVEVVRETLVDFELLFGNLQCQPPYGTSVGATCGKKISAIEAKNSEDAFDRIRDLAENWLNYDRFQRLHVQIQDSKQQVFLGAKKVVEAPRIDLSTIENLRNRRGCVAITPKQIKGCFNNAPSGSALLLNCHLS